MEEENSAIKLPRKAHYRQRAHCNPLSINDLSHPRSPEYVDWSIIFPTYYYDGQKKPTDDRLECKLTCNTVDEPCCYDKLQPDYLNGALRSIDYLDIGCGFGGLLFELGKLVNSKIILGLEIRDQVTNFVKKKIEALRAGCPDGQYDNIGVLRTNSMKFLLNYFRKHSIEKIFILFPDPHFKVDNWKRRIITPQLLATYQYVLKPFGKLYFITDVEETFDWMKLSCDLHKGYIEIPKVECEKDDHYNLMFNATDESRKAARLGKSLHAAVYQKCD